MSVPDISHAEKKTNLSSKIAGICVDLARLDPGPLAELRRMDVSTDTYGAPYFWRLIAKHNLPANAEAERRWAQVIHALAILTPKGRDETKRPRHSSGEKSPDAVAGAPQTNPRTLGTMLCDGGDVGWPDDKQKPRPVYSEIRLAQLLGSSGATRVDLVRRAARMLAARLSPDVQFDCTDLALLLLKPDDPDVGRRTARAYYARLDRATPKQADEEDNSTGDDS